MNKINSKNVVIPPSILNETQSLYFAIYFFIHGNKYKSAKNAVKYAFKKIENEILEHLSSTYHIWIFLYKLDPFKFYKSVGQGENHVKILKWNHKYYLIKNFNLLSKNYTCIECRLIFSNSKNLYKHKCRKNEQIEPIIVHESKIYRDPLTMREMLASLGLHTDINHNFIIFKACYDNESLIKNIIPIENEQHSDEQQKLEEHRILLTCIVSDIPGFEEKSFFTSPNFMYDFVNYMHEMYLENRRLHKIHNQSIFDELYSMKRRAELKSNKNYARRIEKTIIKFDIFISRLQIYSFNGMRFDNCQLIFEGLIDKLYQLEGKMPFIIKDSSPAHYLAIISKYFCFKDILLFLGTPCSLDSACKAYGITGLNLEQLAQSDNLSFDLLCKSGQKLKYPFGLNTDYAKIRENYEDFQFDDFISSMSGDNLLSPHYAKYVELCQLMSNEDALTALSLKEPPPCPRRVLACINDIKKKLNLSHANYLLAYCFADCYITLELVDRIRKSYIELGMDFIDSVYTLSSGAYKLLHRSIEETPGKICSFYTLDDDTHSIVQRGLIGGITFASQKIACDNYIDFHKYGPNALKSSCVKCLDMTSLYATGNYRNGCSVLGPPLIRKRENSFKVDKVANYGREEFLSISYLMENKYKNFNCRTFFSHNGQKVINLGNGTYSPIDLYVIQLDLHVNYHSCWIHACPKHDYDPHAMHPIGMTFAQVFKRTNDIDEQLSKVCNYTVVWGCELNIQDKGPLTHYLFNRLNQSYTEKQLLEAIANEKCHGILTLDLKMCKEALEHHFYKFPLIPIRISFSLDDLQPHYRELLIADGLMKPNERRETIVLSTRGEQVTINTVLLRFYLKFNLVECSNITTFIEFEHSHILEKFYDRFATLKHKAKLESNNIVSLSAKSILNSSYGRSYLNLLKRPKCKYLDSSNISRINNFRSRAAQVTNELYIGDLLEFSYFPKKIKSQNLTHFSFDTLFCAKHEMFLFFYRYFSCHHDPLSYSLCYSDTDSLIISYFSEVETDNILPEKLEDFLKARAQLIVPPEESEEYRKANHFLGHMKIEMVAKFGIFLTAKLYSLLDEKQCKNVQKGIVASYNNMTTYAFIQKLICLLGGTDERRNTMMRNAIVCSFRNNCDKQCLELIKIKKKAITYVNNKNLWCKRMTCGFVHGLTHQELISLYPYANTDCNITLESCLNVIKDFIGDSKLKEYLIKNTFKTS